jgi:Mor family transcriptional regulator
LSYKNGKDILPPELLEELQKYIQGELIYIPKGEIPRSGWGELNGTRKIINDRNREIFRSYKNGLSITKLVEIYNLSDDSIRKIIIKINKELNRNLIHI